jgi:hypothetical protein
MFDSTLENRVINKSEVSLYYLTFSLFKKINENFFRKEVYDLSSD